MGDISKGAEIHYSPPGAKKKNCGKTGKFFYVRTVTKISLQQLMHDIG
jgi:hypothetical protein